MKKIKFKLLRYFLFIIVLTVLIGFLLSSAFLSKYYIMNQYKELKDASEEVYTMLKSGEEQNIAYRSFIITKDGEIIYLNKKAHKNLMEGGNFKGKIPYILNYKQGEFKDKNNNAVLFYNKTSELGNIVVLKDKAPINDYIKILNLVLAIVLFMGVLISFPIAYYLGKKFTKPIVVLKDYAEEVSNENFDSLKVNKDVELEDNEIGELWKSLNKMMKKLEYKNRMQKEFIANVSHDFKTPLSIIRNYSEGIEDGIFSNEDTKKYSRYIIEEVDRLNILVKDVLQLSKYQAGEVEISKENINLKDFLDEVFKRFNPIIEREEMKFILDIKIEGKEVYIKGDKSALTRVLENLITNSIKFSNEGGAIVLGASFIKDTLNDKVKVYVKDKGIGINEEMLKDIWNRYYKHSKKGGMGLGLPISAEILKLHGFEYGVESKVNEGSEFYFIACSEVFTNSSQL